MRHYIVCILCRAYMGVYYMHSFRMSGGVYRDRGYKKVEATKTNLYMKNARQIYTCESVLTHDIVPSSCGGRESPHTAMVGSTQYSEPFHHLSPPPGLRILNSLLELHMKMSVVVV